MRWKKQKHIYAPSGNFDWNKSHAAVPTVDVVSDKVWRIYFGTRDAQNRSHTSFIEVEAGKPENVLYEHGEEILPLGNLGAFDDCGVMPSSIVTVGVYKYLYYIGWTTRGTVPYHNAIGLAISKDGGRTFEKLAEGPLFGATIYEPHFTGTSCVRIENRVWKNWYLSCTKWEMINGKPEPFYHIKYAESLDGIHWKRDGVVAIDYKSETEAGIVGATVLTENGVHKMWYAYRDADGYRTGKAKSYRIGYAESFGGVRWKRLDERAGIDVSDAGWDSEMIEYPFVVAHHGTKFLFYNGNGFGKTGFGYAIAEE
jgi:hypothetical protein